MTSIGGNGNDPSLQRSPIAGTESGPTTEAPSPSQGTGTPPTPSPEKGNPTVSPKTELERFADFIKEFPFRSRENPHQLIQEVLHWIANPKTSGGHEAEFVLKKGVHYSMVQKSLGGPIEVSISKKRKRPKSGEAPLEKIFSFAYSKDTQSSSLDRRQKKFTNALLGLLETRSKTVYESSRAFHRLLHPLGRLTGHKDFSTGAIEYNNFVALGEKVFSFRIESIGLEKSGPSSTVNQIVVTEFSEGPRYSLTLAKTGEINPRPNRSSRQTPNYSQEQLLKSLAFELNQALESPELYQKKLHKKIERINGKQTTKLEAPNIRPQMALASVAGKVQGARGAPIQYIESGWKLLKIIRPWGQPQRWQNPANPKEVRYLRPEGFIRWWHLPKELIRWSTNAVAYRLFHDIRNLRPSQGLLELHLLPDGGAELWIHRKEIETAKPDGTKSLDRPLHNIIRIEPNKPTVKLTTVIRQLKKERPGFKDLPRPQQIIEAREWMYGNMGINSRVQEVPLISLDNLRNIFQRPDVSRLNIENVQNAWDVLHRLPQLDGLEVRATLEDSSSHLEKINSLKSAIGPKTKSIRVDIPGSQPLTHLSIKKVNIQPETGKNINRIEIQLQQGGNHRAVVFDNGQLNETAAYELDKIRHTAVMEGHVPRKRSSRFLSFLVRPYSYTGHNGLAYGVGHFASLLPIWLFERVHYNEEQRNIIGTPVPTASLGGAWHGVASFLFMSFVAGNTSRLLDGTLNFTPGVLSTLHKWGTTDATFSQALARHKTLILYPKPEVRPVRRAFPFLAGTLQRGVPLFAGLWALEMYEHGKVDGQRLKNNFIRVGAVSLATSGIWGAIQRVLPRGKAKMQSSRFVKLMMDRAKLVKPVDGLKGVRWGLTMRASFLTVFIELLALGIWDSIERKNQWATQILQESRNDLSLNLDLRNEYNSRIAAGEDISPQRLAQADFDLQQAQAQYRRILEITENRKGNGEFSALTLENQFGDHYKISPTGSNASIFLHELRSRHPKYESERRGLYQKHGFPVEEPSQNGESLRSMLTRIAKQSLNKSSSSAGADQATPHPSPVGVDSPQGKDILKQFRWKTNQDPSSVHWSREQKADYILKQFTSFQVKEANGTHRSWDRKDALAFINLVDKANTVRAGNLKSSLWLAEHSPKRDERLQKVYPKEQRIHKQYISSRPYVALHSRQLASNVEDFDKQMINYYQRSNAKLTQALQRFVPPGLLAQSQTSPGTSENPALKGVDFK